MRRRRRKKNKVEEEGKRDDKEVRRKGEIGRGWIKAGKEMRGEREKGTSQRRNYHKRRVRKDGLTKSDTVSQSLSSCLGPWTGQYTLYTVHF